MDATAVVDNEREEIEHYMQTHALELQLNAAVNELVKERPADPYGSIATTLQRQSTQANLVQGLQAREVFSAQGVPALQVTLSTIKGEFSATTTIPPFDGDPERFGGRGVRKAVDAAHVLVKSKVVGMELDQGKIDTLLTTVPNVPANVALAVSMACCRAAAKHQDRELFEHIAALANVSEPCVPLPVFSVINGGNAAKTPLPVDILAMPVGAGSFEAALDLGLQLQQQRVPESLDKFGQPNVCLGQTGGLAPQLETVEEALTSVVDAVQQLEPESSVLIGVDFVAADMLKREEPEAPAEGEAAEEGAAATEGEERAEGEDAAEEGTAEGEAEGGAGAVVEEQELKDATYDLNKWNPPGGEKLKTGEDMVDMMMSWVSQFSLASLDDPFHALDSESFLKLKERVDVEVGRVRERAARQAEADEEEAGAAPADGEAPVMDLKPVGNDSTCLLQFTANGACRTAQEMDRFNEAQTINAIGLSLRKGRTVTGCIEINDKARSFGWAVTVAAEREFGETDDAFLAHLAVGLRAGQLKAGGLHGAEQWAKYNELLRVSGLDDAPPFVGAQFRNFTAGEA